MSLMALHIAEWEQGLDGWIKKNWDKNTKFTYNNLIPITVIINTCQYYNFAESLSNDKSKPLSNAKKILIKTFFKELDGKQKLVFDIDIAYEKNLISSKLDSQIKLPSQENLNQVINAIERLMFIGHNAPTLCTIAIEILSASLIIACRTNSLVLASRLLRTLHYCNKTSGIAVTQALNYIQNSQAIDGSFGLNSSTFEQLKQLKSDDEFEIIDCIKADISLHVAWTLKLFEYGLDPVLDNI